MTHRPRTPILLLAAALTVGGFAISPLQAQEVCKPAAETAARYEPLTLHFDTGSTKIKPGDRQKLAEMAKIAKASKIQQICIKGFADKQGNADMNRKLSQARAEAVAAEFGKLGIGRDYLALTSGGEPGGAIYASGQAKSEADRRVEVRIAR